MSSAEVVPAPQPDWSLSSPWRWMLVGVSASGLAFLQARLVEGNWPALHGALILLGLLAAAGAVCLRFQTAGKAPLEGLPMQRRARAALALASVHAALALAFTVLLAVAFAARSRFLWETRDVFVFWLATTPWCAAQTVYFVRRLDGKQAVSERAEGAALLVLAALTAFLACWALYLGPERAGEWDSVRLLLAVVALVAFVASPLVASPQWLRRLVVSALIVLHLGGIVIAVTASPPGPWVSMQLWIRFYHPYLEFMHLNNAYRFYSPEPSPATQLWFRVQYREEKNGKPHSHWVRLPDVDDRGTPQYPVRLQYQRRLSLTENVTRTLPTLPSEYVDLAGNKQRAAYAVKRDLQALKPLVDSDLLGQKKPSSPLKIPYHPATGHAQYAPPDHNSKLLLQSYARHVARRPHPEHPDAKAVSVKIYRVLHQTLNPQELGGGAEPQDLIYFLPYYQGEYDAEGSLRDHDDPFLYWLLPTVRVNWADPDSPILIYAFLHAGDVDAFRRLPPFPWRKK